MTHRYDTAVKAMFLPSGGAAASAKTAQKTIGNPTPPASTTTARRRMSPPPTATTAMLSTRRRGSKPPSRDIPCTTMGSCDIQYATARIPREKKAATALHATASDSIEIADDDDGDSSSLPPPAPSSSSVPADLVEVATFGAPHGVRGEVRIFPVTDEPEERLLEGAEAGARFWVAPQVDSRVRRGGGRGGDIFIGRGSSSSPAAAAPKPRLVRIEAARPAPISRSSKKGSSSSSPAGSSSWLLKLRGIDSPEAAASLANNSLWVSAAERPALPEAGDDFYAQELIGMEARLGDEAAEKIIGVVVDVCEGGGTDLLRLELSDDEEEGEIEVEVEGRSGGGGRGGDFDEPKAAAAKGGSSVPRRPPHRPPPLHPGLRPSRRPHGPQDDDLSPGRAAGPGHSASQGAAEEQEQEAAAAASAAASRRRRRRRSEERRRKSRGLGAREGERRGTAPEEVPQRRPPLKRSQMKKRRARC